MKRYSLLLILSLFSFQSIYAQNLSVDQIMQDPKWMGNFPSNVSWDEKGKVIYFNYNPENHPGDSLYKIHISNPDKIEKVGLSEQRNRIPSNAHSNKGKTKKIFTQKGDLILYDIVKDEKIVLVSLGEGISNAKFLKNENRISFVMNSNIYVFDIDKGKLERTTFIKSGEKPKESEPSLSQKDEWLKNDNRELLGVVREREEKKEETKSYLEATKETEPFTFYTGKKVVNNLQLSPDEKFVTFSLITRAENKRTIVPDYSHISGYTTEINTRTKVGDDPMKVEMAIYNLDKDTVYTVDSSKLPGIKDLPDYVKDYPDKEWEEKERELVLTGPYFSSDGKYAVVNGYSNDNKDRWISLLDLNTGELKNLDRQRDEAWIAGPGIGGSWGNAVFGWLPDDKNIYFQSEASGYSHLYILDVRSGTKRQLTKGIFEVFNPKISNDGKFWYLTTSEVHPGERHLYMMPINGGPLEKLTTMTGNNDVSLSPDEKNIAILYSYSNKPWELFLQANEPGAEPKQLTEGLSDEFKAYDWRDPELITFAAQDGTQVPARLYKPSQRNRNGAAVIFVHGAGYLQNVHKWWSSYFREYMFHNLLTDLGYTVLDIDYRGSAGYGRDWRTAIYRHMGGLDLSDQVDGAKYLKENHNVQEDKIGIYGGSYGGFITLMALFNEAETFTSGAALRSVTDWAHYNHGYTSNILNEPFNDPIAYKRSSPIYFADGLQGNLLIAHGMLDVNVHFQDVVRLAQILIELGKDNWEMAVYPVEDHGFVEPSSWTDEYKRILKLFNDTLLD
ncbi:S9 family peptidase [Mongoliibacter ruber]|uniref:Dipeptidyl aminopeptidase/acylaminoacyl peptidase n=1 Tax=Mongoliibacter ruber TaxID=1750599 RepID=A0A2T0WUT3_9BACT|nr:prolyl oligopeptidase family serine peptidase [Mongoliibacter ruber]PRY90440.1 dipeptidyl aminopeptidase/acylaminoacyl peptidase [Mongoliibacter ruber]